jgi:hypothetical protein
MNVVGRVIPESHSMKGQDINFIRRIPEVNSAPAFAVDARKGSGVNIVYLACPYTDSDPLVRRWRFEMATAAAAILVKRGVVVFSPVTMTHPIDVALAGDRTLGSEFWVKFDEAFMSKCCEMIILKIDGWNTSSGMKREIDFFRKLNKPISFMEYAEIDEFIP